MDPITTAIISALGALGQDLIKDTYNALKAAIAHKCGVDSDVVKSIEQLEKKPDSKGRKETLNEEVVAAKIDQDDEIVKLAKLLIDKLEAAPSESTVIKQQAGDDAIQIGQVSGDVSIKK